MHRSKTLLVLVSILLHHTILAQSYGELQVSNFLDANYHQSLACYDSLLKKKFVPLENHKIALAAINQLEMSDENLDSDFGFTKQDVVSNIDMLENGSFKDEEKITEIKNGEIFKKSEINCSYPINFSQDCPSSTPKGRISLFDENYRIAGSSDGRKIWIKIPKDDNIGEYLLTVIESDRISTNSPFNNLIGFNPANTNDLQTESYRKSIFAFRSIFEILVENKINILEIHTILDKPNRPYATTVGFIMELDGDGYSILKKSSK